MITFRLGRRLGIDLFNPQKIIFLLWLFLLIFPKGGFKLSGIPITWGYLFLGVTSLCIHFSRENYTLHSSRCLSFLLLIPFQIVSAAHLVINGFCPESKGMVISFLVSFFFLPYVFFLLLSQNIETLDLDRFFRLFKKGILFISIYGIFLFIFRHTTGKLIEIPLLTTNLSDFGDLETRKCNNRGFVFKLISTYNNGNLYGICLLIFLPLYCYLEKFRWKKMIVKTSLFLTFSRTIWFGLLFHEFCFNCFIEKGRKRAINILIVSSFVIVAITFFVFYYASLFDFIFDADLGGRKRQLNILQSLTLFSTQSFIELPEIIYAGILHSFGMIGLFTFLVGMTGSLIIQFLKGSLSKLQISMCLGMMNYLFISGADGGILYIPVMAFYWFLCSLLAKRGIRTPFIASKTSSGRI